MNKNICISISKNICRSVWGLKFKPQTHTQTELAVALDYFEEKRLIQTIIHGSGHTVFWIRSR
jgi:hypothetical protein